MASARQSSGQGSRTQMRQSQTDPAAPATAERLVYTVTEVGAMLGLSRNAAYEAARRGDIPTIRIGRRLIVPKVAFNRLLETGASAGDDGGREND
jgi:excisionase family DNA binding protein